ncbi:MGMT family protein [Streptomyces sp. NPDC005438]|uniref:MGMT family protein n=1 Tax=Streptomyces sp. NPDC005438 TaxID=3156880 RepID=UPI0033B5A13F
MPGNQSPDPPLPQYAERVLAVAEAIPPGRVLTYGDIAAWLREEDEELRDLLPDQRDDRPAPRRGARQVGRVMALYGGAVPWWRVVRADGHLLPGSERSALHHYRGEGTPLREPRRTTGSPANGTRPRVDVPRARWQGTGQD